MSLQRLAFMTALGYNNNQQQHMNGNRNNTSNINNNIYTNSTPSTMIATTTTTTAAASALPSTIDTTARISTSIVLSPTQIINGNKSTLIQFKQQLSDIVKSTATTLHISAATANSSSSSSSSSLSPAIWPQVHDRETHQQHEVFADIQSTRITTSPLPPSATTFVASPPLNPYNNDHFKLHGDDTTDHIARHHTQHRHYHGGSSSSSSSSASASNKNNSNGLINSDSIENDEDASNAERDGEDDTGGHQRPINTFYGSGFGIFHQQRSNMGGTSSGGGGGGGGGIALITGSSGNMGGGSIGGSSSGLGGSSYSNGINNNVNLLLGGAMLTLITTILCVVCYCCHRNIKKRTEAAYRQQRQWLENDPNMEIYSVEQCYETSGLFVGDSIDGLTTMPALHHEPPPSYDAVVAMQEQQQLLLQQQQQHLLMQQLQNSSPPPGYRSSLDVSCILNARAAAGLAPATLGMGSNTDTNSLAASSTNLRTLPSRTTPTEFHDLNGNRDMGASGSTPTSTTSSHLQQHPNFMRSTKQRQRNLAPANLANFNMKKVLQAQSCCSLQRAEVENMWNAAAAALAARSNHVASSDARTTASTSSPTLTMTGRKLSANGHITKPETSETFGSRYLRQQNYYRRGCPLCGKFRYDNESTLSISIESDLDNMPMAEGRSRLQEYKEENPGCGGLEEEDEDVEAEDDECSCRNTNQSRLRQSMYPTTTVAVLTNQNYQEQNGNSENIELSTNVRSDLNANCRDMAEAATAATVTSINSSTLRAANNNGNDDIMDENSLQPTTSTSLATAGGVAAAGNQASNTAATPETSTQTGTIDLDCINENGIISLDMSRIIDKTGLPTYDAALKLESSGYV